MIDPADPKPIIWQVRCDSALNRRHMDHNHSLRDFWNIRSLFLAESYLKRSCISGLLIVHKGQSYDNTFAESSFKTLKVEEVYLNEYETFRDASRNIQHFIEKVYNEKRQHSALRYKSLEQFEMGAALNTLAQ